jgi:hypothetical protein
MSGKEGKGSLKKLINTKLNSCKRGQVTIFIILGIVILMVVIFAVLISSSFSKIKLQTEANKAVDSYLQSEAVNYYVYTCMDSAVTSSIFDLAIQGGVFYTYQNDSATASVPGIDYVPYSMMIIDNKGDPQTIFFNVSYSILNNSYCGIVEQDIPQYPLDKTYIKDLFGKYNDYSVNSECLYDAKEGYALSGFAGFNNMTRLCELGSNNTKPIKTEGQSIAFSPCYNSLTTEANKSIEHILERQISIRMANCTDFSVFKDDNITVSGLPDVKVVYTADSVLVGSTYNLTVKIKNKEPVIVKHTFNYKTDLRLARLHNYVMSLIHADSADFFFNINTDYKSYGVHNELNPEKFYDETDMSVQVINFKETCPDCLYKYDHLLIVQDGKSMIGNKPLIYMTMIRNRIPALDYLHTTSDSAYYDLIVSDDETVTLKPQGYDPDDENADLTYIYDGWKEAYDETCSILPYSLPEDQAYLLVNMNCQKISGEAPRLWTHSNSFTATKRNADYKTMPTDLGPHNVTISIKDISGLIDYQIVHILVFDLPKAIISAIHLYDLTDAENKASTEDYMTLDGTGSTASTVMGGTVTSFMWKIDRINPAGNVFTGNAAEAVITFPTATDYNYLIQTIKSTATGFQTPGEYKITLSVGSSTPSGTVVSSPVTKNIDVSECVPHHSSDLPFPYNTGADPFRADHRCCNDDNTLKASGAVCYNTEKYGEKDMLAGADFSNNNRFTNYPLAWSQSNALTYSGAGKPNDIYKLTFARECDGYRGNMCAGAMTRTIEVVQPCAVKLLGETETCSGPSSEISDNAPLACVPYNIGDSFEKLFNKNDAIGNTANGICNEVSRCSSPGYLGYGITGGKMLCQAKCEGGTCKYADNCACSVSSCGAQCDGTAAHSYSLMDTTCYYGCDLENSCVFLNSKHLPCAGSSCFVSSGLFANYCYGNVVCNAQGGGFSKSFCMPGKVDPDNQDICLVDSAGVSLNRCDTSGTCKFEKKSKAALTCSGNQAKVCTTSGWICQ